MISRHSVMMELWQYGPKRTASLGPEAVRALVDISLDASPKMRPDAMSAIKYMGKDAVAELLHLMQYGAGDVKVKSATMLGMIGEKTMIPEALEPLQSLQSQENNQARKAAQSAIEKIERRICEEKERKSEPCRRRKDSADGVDMAGEILDSGIRDPKMLARMETRGRKRTGKESNAPKIDPARKKAINM